MTVEAVRVLFEAMRVLIEAVRKIIEAMRLFVEAVRVLVEVVRVLVKAVRVGELCYFCFYLSHKVLSKFVRFASILFGLNPLVSSSILAGF